MDKYLFSLLLVLVVSIAVYLILSVLDRIFNGACRCNSISDLFYAFLPESKKDKELRAKVDACLLKKQNERSMYNAWISSLTNSIPSYIDGGTITPKKDDFVNALLHQKDTKIFELETELSLLKQKSIRFEKDSINKRYSIVECIEHQVLLLDANVIKPTDVLNLIKKIKNNISTELPKE